MPYYSEGLLCFKAYCLCIYDAALWKGYNIGTLHSTKCGHDLLVTLQ